MKDACLQVAKTPSEGTISDYHRLDQGFHTSPCHKTNCKTSWHTPETYLSKAFLFAGYECSSLLSCCPFQDLAVDGLTCATQLEHSLHLCQIAHVMANRIC